MIKKLNLLTMPNKPVLLFAYGNESRGDDALAPMLLNEVISHEIKQVAGHPLKLLSDYQLQIEHVIDMQGCERVIFIDADASLQQPFHFYPVTACAESLYTTHGMSPPHLLHTFEKVLQQKSPLTYLLAISGDSFELGEKLSENARQNLKRAAGFLFSLLNQDSLNWHEVKD